MGLQPVCFEIMYKLSHELFTSMVCMCVCILVVVQDVEECPVWREDHHSDGGEE